MNKQANILFFIGSSSGGNPVVLNDSSIRNSYYQHLIHSALACASYSQDPLQSLARRLASIADHALMASHLDGAEKAAQLMLGLPVSNRFHSIARYYEAQCLRYRGNFLGARRIFESVAETATAGYRARALQCIGATHHDSGQIDEGLSFFVSAGAVAADPFTTLDSQWMVAVVRSIQGDHRQALKDLERLFPLVRIIGRHYPALYYDYLNSLAVEFGEVGRLDEAHGALNIALASPFASAYPNWAVTRNELEAKRTAATPSVVAVTRAVQAAESPKAQPDPKPCRAKVLAASWLLVATGSPTKLSLAAQAVGHHTLTASGLDRLDDSIQPRAPPARS